MKSLSDSVSLEPGWGGLWSRMQDTPLVMIEDAEALADLVATRRLVKPSDVSHQTYIRFKDYLEKTERGIASLREVLGLGREDAEGLFHFHQGNLERAMQAYFEDGDVLDEDGND